MARKPLTPLRTVKLWVRLLVCPDHRTYLIDTYRTKKPAVAEQKPGEVVIQMVGHYMPGQIKRAPKTSGDRNE